MNEKNQKIQIDSQKNKALDNKKLKKKSLSNFILKFLTPGLIKNLNSKNSEDIDKLFKILDKIAKDTKKQKIQIKKRPASSSGKIPSKNRSNTALVKKNSSINQEKQSIKSNFVF